VQEAEFGHLQSRHFTKAVPAETTKIYINRQNSPKDFFL